VAHETAERDSNHHGMPFDIKPKQMGFFGRGIFGFFSSEFRKIIPLSVTADKKHTHKKDEMTSSTF